MKRFTSPLPLNVFLNTVLVLTLSTSAFSGDVKDCYKRADSNGDSVPVLGFRGEILADAPEGFSPLRLSNGPDDAGVGRAFLKNEVTVRGQAQRLVLDSQQAGGMRVSADIVIFMRGDLNQDGDADMTEAILILGHLFLGDPAVLNCPDAADADDSGEIDITDPIRTLTRQFIGTVSIADPFPAEGRDRTFDRLLPCTRD